MIAKERAKGIYKEIKKEYGGDFAKEMIHSIVYNVANYDGLTYEERKDLYEDLYNEISRELSEDTDNRILQNAI